MKEVESVLESEEGNFKISREALGDALGLVEAVKDLYELLKELAKAAKLEPRDELVSAFVFLLACQYELTMAVLHIMRGHLVESYRCNRRAIEQCAFAARIAEHPHLAEEWVNAVDSDVAYEKYREKFSGGKIFPDDHPLLKVLGERYDACAKLSHPSIHALAQHMKAEKAPNAWSLTFAYFQVGKGKLTEPLLTFLLCMTTHFLILRVFAEILAEAVAHDPAKWEVWRNGLDALLGVQKLKLKGIVDAVSTTTKPVAFHLIGD